ncbi:MAG: CoB--CoM heterodisulfide reductase iron-sulfur subunit A family protein [Magnetococcales bacterium]|nr:CoB--CoM heterodisulfide reductase iron-sulfur subunit A family protein [Magnetococcales bacterium]
MCSDPQPWRCIVTTGNGGSQTILVVGGGISGLTAAVEAAEVGYSVILVEKNPYLGGRVAQHNKYFPKLCTPTCGLEINYQRIRNNARITFYTLAEVEEITGTAGHFSVRVRQNPRFVNDKCTACDECSKACTTQIDDPFNFGMGQTKAIGRPHAMAFPARYVMDATFAKSDEARKLAQLCPVGAIEPDMEAKTVTLTVGSIIWATGWQPYDPGRVRPYGFGLYANVINNMRFERLSSGQGPTRGQIVRPSDGKAVKNIAFIQCAGSRDHNYLPFCSQICCLASMKQATYIREQYPDAKVTIYYIDLRAMDRYEAFQKKVEADAQVHWVKSKPARIDEDPKTHDPIVMGENTLTGERYAERYDLVVLATGMEPNSATSPIPAADVRYDDYGFVVNGQNGIHAVGCSAAPVDVASAVQASTAAALKAIQTIRQAGG